MTWTVEFEGRARREFLNLDRTIQELLADAIDDLRKTPRPAGAKRLVGKAGYRIRKGDWRVLYTIDDKAGLIRIYRLGHRREVYRST